MTQRQFGTLKYINDLFRLRQDDLRKLHAGTLRSLMQRKWIYTWDTADESWVALSELGREALASFKDAEASMRQHEGDLTACTLRLLRMVRMRQNQRLRKVG